MRVAIIAHHRSGSTNLSKWLSMELGYEWISEPYNTDTKYWNNNVKERYQKSLVNEINTMNNSLIIYENKGDSLRWHTDKSMFNNKKVYTLLIYLHNSSSQNLCYINHDKKKTCLYTPENSCVILEHFTLEHAVTELKENEKKILWSMTYAEDINITNPISYIMNKCKNISYMGFNALSALDIFFIILILLILLSFIYFLFKNYIYKKKSIINSMLKKY